MFSLSFKKKCLWLWSWFVFIVCVGGGLFFAKAIKEKQYSVCEAKDSS